MVNGVSEHSYLMPVTQLRETHSFENIHQGLISSILPQYAQAGATRTYCAQCALHTHAHTHSCTHMHKNEPENLAWVLGKDTTWELAFQRQNSATKEMSTGRRAGGDHFSKKNTTWEWTRWQKNKNIFHDITRSGVRPARRNLWKTGV